MIIVSYPNPQGNHNIKEGFGTLIDVLIYPNPQGNHNTSISQYTPSIIVFYPNPQGNHNSRHLKPKNFIICFLS